MPKELISEDLDALFALKPYAIACPHVPLRGLRQQGSVVWLEQLNAFAVTRYDEVVEVLSDTERFSSAIGDPRGPNLHARMAEVRNQLTETSAEFRALMARLQPDWRGHRVLLSADGDEHTMHRKLVSRMFTPKRAAALEPRLQEIADECVDAFVDSESVELVSALCVALPLRIIAEQLGIGTDHLTDFKRWSVDANATIGNDSFKPDDVVRITRSNVEFSEYFRPLMAARRIEAKDDFVTTVVQADEADLSMTDEIRLAIISQMLGAGNETSAKILAEGAAYLAENPDMREHLRRQPDRLEPFVEEMLRLGSPTQGLYRTVTRDTQLAGVALPAGSAVLVLYASANRTDSEFPNPDVVDLDRDNLRNHLAFGKGAHFCPGSPLARITVRVGLRTMLRRLPDWSIAADLGGEQFNESYLLHGRSQLWIRFHRDG